ncbi:glycosyltransferase family 25 protein [Avibacterium sp. 20-15]|uniref:glycosyltransferase family 25 protein n=1 Tax=unclassified Avibacterium TaxID=2685287 RepID=UPI002025BD25|nr:MULTISPECIES: glycosyltransferase family 25 protein [unclassified Avibacterium]MCW9732131.1 glycosyltransferase family 25 protein [Avibacterium sp. 20-15]URL04308.1 glycosyltransferase family 25 protein [Avibacterium sp. 20-132]
MKKFLISLDKDHQRRELFFSQPDTRDFTVFSAINTMQETPENLTALYDQEKFSQRYGRNVTKGEIGCTLSHLAVYALIAKDTSIQEDEYCLICEDDALFNQDFQYHLTALLKENIQADIILIGQSKIDHFNHSELEINYPTTFSFLRHRISGTGFSYSYPYRNYFAGTVAYLIKKSAVKPFLAEEKPYWLADDYILFENKFSLDTQVIRPLLAIENPTLMSNLEAVRGSAKHYFWQKLMKYPLKKLLAIKRNLIGGK